MSLVYLYHGYQIFQQSHVVSRKLSRNIAGTVFYQEISIRPSESVPVPAIVTPIFTILPAMPPSDLPLLIAGLATTCTSLLSPLTDAVIFLSPGMKRKTKPDFS